MPRPGGERPPHLWVPSGAERPQGQRQPSPQDDPYLGLNPDALPDIDREGNVWIPWDRAEAIQPPEGHVSAAGAAMDKARAEAGIARPGRRTEKTDVLAEIMAEKGIGVVKFGFPAGHRVGMKDMYPHHAGMDAEHVERQRQAGVPEDQITHLTHPHETQQDNIHGRENIPGRTLDPNTTYYEGILPQRSRRDGIRYTMQPGATRPGQPWLVNKEESIRDDNDVPVPETSKEGVRISPRRHHEHGAHKPGSNEYQPRMLEGLGDRRRERTERMKEGASELPLIRGGLSKVRALKGKMKRDPNTKRKI
jgi:hypothetical protein